MNRIFHARIVWYQYFLLVVLGINAFGFLWCKNIIYCMYDLFDDNNQKQL